MADIADSTLQSITQTRMHLSFCGGPTNGWEAEVLENAEMLNLLECHDLLNILSVGCGG
jgi:hypothetical protein